MLLFYKENNNHRRKNNYSGLSILVVKTKVYNSQVCSPEMVPVFWPILPAVIRELKALDSDIAYHLKKIVFVVISSFVFQNSPSTDLWHRQISA